jgi:hypothetical protein
MPVINPAVIQWIRQLAGDDQAAAFYAYQSLQEEILQASRPGQERVQAALARVLGEELVAEAKAGDGRATASFRDNVFLAAAATAQATPRHPARVRVSLARLLGYIPRSEPVPYLARAMGDLEVRDMARQSLECNQSDAATEALVAALDATGPEFCCGVVSSLAKRREAKAAAALRRAARNQQEDVRVAALFALAEFPEPEHDAILERASKAPSAAERLAAHIARARLAAALRAGGKRSEAERIDRAILASDAPEAQKNASRLALGQSVPRRQAGQR